MCSKGGIRTPLLKQTTQMKSVKMKKCWKIILTSTEGRNEEFHRFDGDNDHNNNIFCTKK